MAFRSLKAQSTPTRNREAEPHPENVFVTEKDSFQGSVGNLKGGVRDTVFLEPIY